MILLALVLVGFGAADIGRWSPGPIGGSRALVAAGVGTAAVAALAALGGIAPLGVLAAALIALGVLGLWSAYDLLPKKHAKPEYALVLVAGVIGLSVAFSASGRSVEGSVADWYSNLTFGFSHDVSVDQFLIGFGATLFLLATANRIVRYTLNATGSSLAKGEDTLRGGRLLGPMERIFVAASIVSGSLAGAGLVIAAKGLLRFREIGGTKSDIDKITEYFLIGTFTSVLVAATAAILILASS